MTNTPSDHPVIGLVGPRDELAEALAASGREVRPLDGPDDRVDLVLCTGDADKELAHARLVEAAGYVGEDVPLVHSGGLASVTDLAARVANPARVVGLHLLTGGAGRGAVEVVPGLLSDASVVDRVTDLVDSLEGVVPIAVKDRPGLLLNSLFLPYLNDVIAEYDDELATAEDIDVALELGLGYKVGPFKLLDAMGLDRHLAATEAVHAATGDSRYAPPPLLRQLVAAGRLGAATGQGFLTHPDTHH